MASASKPASCVAQRNGRTICFAPRRDRTLPAMLTRQAERFGTNRWSLRATDPELRAHATPRHGLQAACAGWRPAGDRVALICSNRMEFIEALLGCAWLGAVAVPINTASRGRSSSTSWLIAARAC